MSYSKKRAAIIVPTAFLVALSGMVAAPAMAEDGTSPQAVVDGTYDATQNADSWETQARSFTVSFKANNGVDKVPAGLYWIQVEKNGTVIDYVERDIAAEATSVDLTYDASGAAVDDEFVFTFVEMNASERNRSYATLADQEAVFGTAANLGTEDELTVTIIGTNAVTVTAATTTVAEGGTAYISYNHLSTSADYVVVAANRVVHDLPGAGAATATAEYAALRGDAGAQQIQLFRLTTNQRTAFDALTATDTQTLGQAQYAYIRSLNIAPVHSQPITVTAATATVKVTEDTGVEDDGTVVTGEDYTIEWDYLPTLPAGQNYVVTVTKDGVNVVDPAAVGLGSLSASPTAGFQKYTTTISSARALDAGSTLRYTLTGGGVNLSTNVVVQKASAKFVDGIATPIQVGDSPVVVEYSTFAAGTTYYVVTSTKTGDDPETAVASGALTTEAALETELAPATGAAQTVSKEVYVLRQNVTLPATGQVAFLRNNANTVSQLATPFTTVVGEADARFSVSTPEFDVTDTNDIVFTFENLDALDPALDGTTDVALVLKTTESNSRTSERLLTNSVAGLPTGVTVVPAADNVVVTIDDAARIDGATYEVFLYRMPTNVLAGYATDELRLGAVKNTAVGGGIVKSNAGLDQIAVAKSKEAIQPTVPNWEGTLQNGQEIPSAFRSIPRTVNADNIFVGDWNGDGVDTPAYRVPGTNTFYMADSLASTTDLDTWTRMDYGTPTTTVYVGDWDGNGTDTFAVRVAGTNKFQFRNDFAGGTAERETDYGRAGDEVIVGSFKAGAGDTLNVRRGNEFHLKYDFSGGDADLRTDFGRATDEVIIGDFDGNGVDSPGVRRGNVFFLNNEFDGGAVPGFTLGLATDKAFVVKLAQGSKVDTVGVMRLATNN